MRRRAAFLVVGVSMLLGASVAPVDAEPITLTFQGTFNIAYGVTGPNERHAFGPVTFTTQFVIDPDVTPDRLTDSPDTNFFSVSSITTSIPAEARALFPDGFFPIDASYGYLGGRGPGGLQDFGFNMLFRRDDATGQGHHSVGINLFPALSGVPLLDIRAALMHVIMQRTEFQLVDYAYFSGPDTPLTYYNYSGFGHFVSATGGGLNVQAVPEPGSLALVTMGIAGAWARGWRRRRAV